MSKNSQVTLFLVVGFSFIFIGLTAACVAIILVLEG